MKVELRVCRDCGDEFELVVGAPKPGFVDQCPGCATEVPLLGGNMIWSHKTAPEIEVKTLVEARAFARLQKRLGAGVSRSLVESKKREFEDVEASKDGSGAEPRALYISKLGEKRSVKA